MALKDTAKCSNVAAIFGVTGLVGKELATLLLSRRGWKVYGIARRPEEIKPETGHGELPSYHFISCDLLCPLEVEKKLSSSLEDVTHVFWVTWAAGFPAHSIECYNENKAMMANVLNAILPKAKGLRHFSLQTGVKHYISLQGNLINEEVDGLYHEESPRVDEGCNFYYALEDLMQERLLSYNVAWSIHRPGLITGCSRKTFYNFVGSICIYGTICKYLNLPFVFGGTKHCWEEMYIDGSDARLVAEQHVWIATMQNSSNGQAFNSINGECYKWKEIWQAIGVKLGVEGESSLGNNMFSEDFVFSKAMNDKGELWKEIVEKEGLVETKMEELANWSFLDMLFRYPNKMLVTRKKVDMLGFKTRYNVLDSMLYWIDVMRAEKYIP